MLKISVSFGNNLKNTSKYNLVVPEIDVTLKCFRVLAYRIGRKNYKSLVIIVMVSTSVLFNSFMQ